MSNIKKFSHDIFGEIRVVMVKGYPMFNLYDTAFALGYTKTAKNKLYLRKELIQKVTENLDIKGLSVSDNLEIEINKDTDFENTYINEESLYDLIMESNAKYARGFRKWVTGEVLPTIRKTGGYVANDDLFISTYLPHADETTKLLFQTTLQTVRKQNQVIDQQRKEIEYKENIIVNLVDEVSLAEKRQILNQVVRKNGFKNIAERWNKLYKEFEMKYHINLKSRLERYNVENKPKLKNKLDYIDKVMNKIPELYEIACKLYENDIDELVKEMYELNGKQLQTT